MLSPEGKTALLAVARASVAGTPATQAHIPELLEHRAAFVSLHTRTGHDLRGCIGTFAFDQPLRDVVQRMARAAAFEDPRFAPVERIELDALRFEVSALTPPEKIAAKDIEVGRHGLLISRGSRRGVLLPQVPVEWKWDREAFLINTCRKAGLPDDAWQDPDTRIEAFEAEVFSEP